MRADGNTRRDNDDCERPAVIMIGGADDRRRRVHVSPAASAAPAGSSGAVTGSLGFLNADALRADGALSTLPRSDDARGQGWEPAPHGRLSPARFMTPAPSGRERGATPPSKPVGFATLDLPENGACMLSRAVLAPDARLVTRYCVRLNCARHTVLQAPRAAGCLPEGGLTRELNSVPVLGHPCRRER